LRGNEAVGSGAEQPAAGPRSALRIILAIMAAGMAMVGCGLLGTMFFLQRSFVAASEMTNPDEKAASLHSNITGAQVSTVLALIGLAVAILGPVVHWLVTRKRSPGA
jgi:hypothetical protein